MTLNRGGILLKPGMPCSTPQGGRPRRLRRTYRQPRVSLTLRLLASCLRCLQLRSSAVERLNLAGQAARTAVSAQSALRACMRSLNALTSSGAPRFRRPRSASAPPGTRSLQPLQTLHEPEPSASRRARLGGVPAGVVALGRRRRAAAGPRQRMAAPGRASGEVTRSQVRDLGGSRVRDCRGQESIPKSG